MRVLVINNDEHYMNLIKTILINYSALILVDYINDTSNLLKEVEVYKPALIITNINLLGNNHEKALNEFTEKTVKTKLILISNTQNININKFKKSIIEILYTPINKDLLNAAILSIFDQKLHFESQFHTENSLKRTIVPNNKLKFNTQHGFFMLAPEEIIFIQADWNYSELFLDDMKSELVTVNLGKLIEMLPKDIFYRINRSIIINLNYLSRVDRRKKSLILLKSGKEMTFKVPILNIRKLEHFLDQASQFD